MALFMFGVGEICGGPSIGAIIDRYGSKKAVFFNLLMLLLTAPYAI
jgi:predicted MFS family arabinose efflux permease